MKNVSNGWAVVICVLILTALILAISWGLTMGIIYLIALCFGWTFSLAYATGAWLILTLVGSFFTTSVKSK